MVTDQVIDKYSSMIFAVRPPILLRLLSDMYGALALLTTLPMLYALPIMAFGIPFIDAWFEAVSGITTTGLSTLQIDDKPAAFLFARGWMQWVGGMGVVILALALFVRPGGTATKLGFNKREMDDLVGGTHAHAKRVIPIYLILTALGISALLLAGATPLDAVVHCMSAVSTGGFSNYADSLASVGPLQLVIINVLCMAGAISFYVYYRSLFFSGKGSVVGNQFYTLLIAVGVGTSLLWRLATLSDIDIALADIITLVISSQTTAGFSTVVVSTLPAWFLLVLCVAMAVGGGLGSTSGGFKLDRTLILLKLGRLAIMRPAAPDQVYVSANAGRGGVDADAIEEVTALATWFLIVVFISWVIFVYCGFPPVDALFEVTSALATAGLSAGITDATLPPFLKFVLCCNMLFGRVELLAFLVLLSPRSWLGRRHVQRRAAP